MTEAERDKIVIRLRELVNQAILDSDACCDLFATLAAEYDLELTMMLEWKPKENKTKKDRRKADHEAKKFDSVFLKNLRIKW